MPKAKQIKANIDYESRKKVFYGMLIFFLTLIIFLLMVAGRVPVILRITLFIPFYGAILPIVEAYYGVPISKAKSAKKDIFGSQINIIQTKSAILALVCTIAVLLF